jgi:hypothetical protein
MMYAVALNASRELYGAGGAPLRRPVVYFDWSTLSDAFPGAHVGADRAARTELAELMARIVNRGTLCFSAVHLIELAAMEPRESALAVARWLDRFEYAWVQMSNAEEDELIQSVRLVLGLTTQPVRLPVHHTMTAAMRDSLDKITPLGTVDLLRDPTIAGYVGQAHGRIGWAGPKAWSVGLFKRLHADRTTLPPGTTSEAVHQKALSKFSEALKRTARDALLSEPVLIGSKRLTEDEIDSAVDRLFDDPLSLPMNRIVKHVFTRVGDRIAAQTAGSKNFSARYGSFLWDVRHAVSAGFADVFTCDRFADEALGNLRGQWGLPRQLSLGGCGGMTEFVTALRDQVESVQRS